jgi:hypothetical protein
LISPRRSRWREYIEARDAVLGVISRPLLPSQLLRLGPTLGSLLANPNRSRVSWLEGAGMALMTLG